MFNVNDKVMVNCQEIGISGKEELGIICNRIMSSQSYEVSLLKDHNPMAAFDDIRVFNVSEMRIATPEEVNNAMTEWENKNNYKLR